MWKTNLMNKTCRYRVRDTNLSLFNCTMGTSLQRLSVVPTFWYSCTFFTES